MEATPPLDQVSSQAVSRLAAERGLAAAVSPAGEETVRKPGRGWKRWLPYLFFGLSLFALGSMALGISALADDGWSWTDAVELALMAILVVGVVSQARTMLRPTRAGRWLAARRRSVPETSNPSRPHTSYALDAVSAEYLSAIGPANAAAMRRGTALKHAGSRWFDRAAVVTVVALATLAFLGMLFVLGWIVYAAGPSDPSLWLTAPFTGLSGFATWQLFGSARMMSFRGRPYALVSRAFRDTVRVWGSGSIATKVALTTTATASVAGAAVAPSLIDRDTKYDIFVVDSASAAFYRIDLQTDVSVRAPRETEALSPVAIATTTTPVTTRDGKKLLKGSMIVIVAANGGGVQGIAGLGPGGAAPVSISRIEPAIPGAWFTGGPGVLHAVQPDGAFWQVDIRSGAATKVGQLSIPAGPLTYEHASKSLVMVSGAGLAWLEPASGAVLAVAAETVPAGKRVCGIADGPEDLLFFSITGQPDLLVARTKSRTTAPLVPLGEPPPSPCQLTVAIRK